MPTSASYAPDYHTQYQCSVFLPQHTLAPVHQNTMVLVSSLHASTYHGASVYFLCTNIPWYSICTNIPWCQCLLPMFQHTMVLCIHTNIPWYYFLCTNIPWYYVYHANIPWYYFLCTNIPWYQCLLPMYQHTVGSMSHKKCRHLCIPYTTVPNIINLSPCLVDFKKQPFFSGKAL